MVSRASRGLNHASSIAVNSQHGAPPPPVSEYAVMPSHISNQYQYQQPHQHHPGYMSDNRSQAFGITMGTIRSTKSVPALTLMHNNHHHHNHHGSDGSGCPVHGQELMRHQGPPPPTAYSMIHGPVYAAPHTMDRRMMAASVMDLRSLGPGHTTTAAFDKKMGGMTLPVGMYHPRMILSPGQNKISPMELYGVTGGGPAGLRVHQVTEPVCCKGHLIVLWIILAVVTMGVISAIVLGVTMN